MATITDLVARDDVIAARSINALSYRRRPGRLGPENRVAAEAGQLLVPEPHDGGLRPLPGGDAGLAGLAASFDDRCLSLRKRFSTSIALLRHR